MRLLCSALNKAQGYIKIQFVATISIERAHYNALEVIDM